MLDVDVAPSAGSKMNRVRPLINTPFLTVVIELPTPHSTPTSPVFPSQSIDPSLLSVPEDLYITRKRKIRRSRQRPTRATTAPVTKAECAAVTAPSSRPVKSACLKPIPVTLPPPPLFRPTTFWRKTRRSGVTGASYSPSFDLVRLSACPATVIEYDEPCPGLAAFCSERRLLAAVVLFLFFRCGKAAPSHDLVDRDVPSLMFGPPIVVPTSTSTFSIDWWPYHTSADTPSSTITEETLVITTTVPDTSSISVATSTKSAFSTTSYIEISALPADATSPPRPHSSTNVAFKSIYLAPIFGAVGIFVGALSAWLCFRCRSRSRRSQRSDGLEPGPPYEPTEKDLDDYEDGSPSKSMRDSTYSDNRGLLTRNLTYRIPPPFNWPTLTPKGRDDHDPFLEKSPTRASTVCRTERTTTTSDFMSPNLSILLNHDQDEVVLAPYDSLNHKSIRAGILDKLKMGTSKRKAGQVRSRNGHSRLDSDTQVVDAESWGLGWMKGSKDVAETYTALPPRLASSRSRNEGSPSTTGMRRVDSTMLPTSPTILSSARMDSDLFFSPVSSVTKAPEKKIKRWQSLKREKTLPPPPMPSSTSLSSVRPSESFYEGSSPPKRSVAERYMARHSALNKVEEIISKSRSDNMIAVPHSPTLFGAVPSIEVDEDDLEWVGIEQRLLNL